LADHLNLIAMSSEYDAKLDELSALAPGWGVDGDEEPLSPAAIAAVRRFLAAASICPAGDGTIQVEWHTHRLRSLEVVFNPAGEVDEVWVEQDGWKVGVSGDKPPYVAPRRADNPPGSRDSHEPPEAPHAS
jgi:hypothetical protein